MISGRVFRGVSLAAAALMAAAALTGCQSTETVEESVVAVAVVEAEPVNMNGTWEKKIPDGVMRLVVTDETLIGILISNRRYGGIGGLAIAKCNQTATRATCSITQFRDIPEDPPIGHTFSFAYEINSEGKLVISNAYDDGGYMTGTWSPVASW